MAKKNESKTSLAKKEDSPTWLEPVSEDEIVDGLENMRPGDLLVPRLILLQGLSPQVTEGDCKPGQIINSITGDIWIDKDEEVEFIPVYHYLEWIQWGDRELREGIKERTLDPESKLAQMAMRGQKYTDSKGVDQWIVTEYHNFVSLLPSRDMKMPVVISCAKTNHKKGRKLLGLARYRGRFPLYAGMYTICSKSEENQSGQKYYVFDFGNAGWVTQEAYKAVKELYTQLKEAYKDRRLFADQQDEESANIANETEM